MTKIYHTKKVAQRDPQGNICKVYDSVRHAAYCADEVFTAKQLYNHLYHESGALWHGYYWEWYEEADNGALERQCLGTDCTRKFISRGPHNRFCPRCSGLGGDNPFTYKVHGEGKKT